MALSFNGAEKPDAAPLLVIPEGTAWQSVFSDTLPPEWQDTMIARASEGCSEHEIFCHLRITPACWRKAMAGNKEFQAVFELAMRISRGWWDNTGRTQLHNQKFNSYLYALQMINRHGYLAKRKAEETNDAMKAKLEADHEEAAPAELDHLFAGQPQTGGVRAGLN